MLQVLNKPIIQEKQFFLKYSLFFQKEVKERACCLHLEV